MVFVVLVFVFVLLFRSVANRENHLLCLGLLQDPGSVFIVAVEGVRGETGDINDETGEEIGDKGEAFGTETVRD